LPEEARKYAGERAEDFVFDLVKNIFSKALGKRIKAVVGNVEPERLVKAFFNFFDLIGKPYKYKIISLNPLTIEILSCPHKDYAKDKLSCVACLAAVAGALETAYGSAKVEAFGKVYGDPEAKAVLKREGEPGRCKWVIEVRE
jgi:hypothetical protein